MNAFTSFFGKIGHVFTNPTVAADVKLGETVLSALNPGLGAVVETIANVVYTVESSATSSTGATKKATAQSILDTAAPSMLQVLSGVVGKSIDAATAGPIIDKLIDDVVTAFNDLGVFAHTVTTATAAPAPAPATTPAS